MTHDDLIAGLRTTLAANRDLHREPPAPTLDELDRPELHARVDALREVLPKGPSMREEVPGPHEDAAVAATSEEGK